MVVTTSFWASAVLAAFATLTSAQAVAPPPDFVPAELFETLSIIDLKFGDNLVIAGEMIPGPETAFAPTVGYAVSPTLYGSIFLVDIDVPRNGTRTTLLHWFVPNVPLTNGDVFTNPLTIPVPGNGTLGAPYLQPSPPAGDIPHRYVFYCFSQYDGFAIPADSKFSHPTSTADRIGFNLTAFAKEAGLFANANAENYFLVQTPADTANTTGSSATGASATATVAPYKGGATVNKGISWTAGIGGLCVAVWCMMF